MHRLFIVVLFALLPARAAAQGVGAWVFAAAATAGASLLDHEARAVLRDETPRDPGVLGSFGEVWGETAPTVIAVAGLWSYGVLADDAAVERGARRSVGALIAVGTINLGLKSAVGRARPHMTMGASAFQPGTLDDLWHSAPSGHTALAFSVATLLDEELDIPVVTAAGYGAAMIVGWSRVHADAHWLSDVVAGAGVGILVPRLALKMFDRWGAEPVISPTGASIRIPLPVVAR